MEQKRSPAEIKGAIHLISGLNHDISNELDSFNIGLSALELSEDEMIEKVTLLMESNSHYDSVLMTLLWLYGKITDEELLFGKLPKRLCK